MNFNASMQFHGALAKNQAPDSDPHRPTVLTIHAHADDEVLPAAGTLRLMAAAGWQVRCLILTNGNHSRSANGQRHQEAASAGKIIGATYQFFDLEECHFSGQAVIQVAESAIAAWQPTLIMTHAPQSESYGHRDHSVCSTSVANVATRKNITLWYTAPPVFLRGFEPNFFVDITPVIKEKISAIQCYESESEKVFMQLDSILVLARFWARELGQKDGYFEAFQISRQSVDAKFFSALAAGHTSE